MLYFFTPRRYFLKMTSPLEYLTQTAQESIAAKQDFVKNSGEKLVEAAKLMATTIRDGGKIMVIGNGGSAADAQHMVAEMVGHMLVRRRPLPAVALTTDTSNITAIGNDYSYEEIFIKQVQALARKGDILIALSTSGKSKNVIAAVKEARTIGCKIIGLTGGAGGELAGLSDYLLCVSKGMNSSRIQESHIFAYHSLVDLLDRFFLDKV